MSEGSIMSPEPDLIVSTNDDIPVAFDTGMVQDVGADVKILSELDKALSDFQPSSEFLMPMETNRNSAFNIGNYRSRQHSPEGEFEDDEESEIDPDDEDHFAENLPDIDKIDERALEAEIAKKMNSLSMKQRDEALYDMHGVGNVRQETPELMQQSLQELEDRIQRQKARFFAGESKAYCLAESQDPDYVQRKSFRLQFLRSKQFDTREACVAIFRHFKVKQELFGDSWLIKDISLKDLDGDDMACLQNGALQMLPVCDPAGRYVFVVLVPHFRYTTIKSMARQFWYVGMCVADMSTAEAHNKGLVVILYNVKPKRIVDKTLPLTLRRIRMALPYRISSMHQCADKAGLATPFLDWVRTFAMEKGLQIRTRVHRGSHEECMDALENVGIPANVFPIKDGQFVRRERHKAWIESRKLIEEAREQKQEPQTGFLFLAPSQSDVLLGRGKASQTHIGNLKFRLMMEANMDRFDSLSRKGDKMSLSMEMVEKVKSSGGHFLKFDKGMWTAVSDQEACNKAAHDFRTLRKKPKADRIGRIDIVRAELDCATDTDPVRAKRTRPS